MNEDKPPIVHETKETRSEDRERERKNARDNLRHAGEFTKIENTAIVYVLRGWFGALIRPENSTEIVQASDDVWAKQTLFEHFDSELNSGSHDSDTGKPRGLGRIAVACRGGSRTAEPTHNPTPKRTSALTSLSTNK